MEPGSLLFAAVAFLLGIAVTAWRNRRRRQRAARAIAAALQEQPPPVPIVLRPTAWPAPRRTAPAPPRTAQVRRSRLLNRRTARQGVVLMTILGPCRALEHEARK
jgi:hypothetical protein